MESIRVEGAGAGLLQGYWDFAGFGVGVGASATVLLVSPVSDQGCR